MRRISLAHLLIAIAWLALGAAILRNHVWGSHRSERLEDGDGVTVSSLDGSHETRLTSDGIANPAWKPFRPNPPLDPRAAALAAVRFFEKNAWYNLDENWGIAAIALVPIDAKHGVWCWCVSITVPDDEYAVPEEVYVAMNGEVINPRSRPITEKPQPRPVEPDVWELYGVTPGDAK